MSVIYILIVYVIKAILKTLTCLYVALRVWEIIQWLWTSRRKLSSGQRSPAICGTSKS